MEATASRANVRMSIKKYLEDSLVNNATEPVPVFFDKGFALPDTDRIAEWFSVIFRKMSRTGLSDFYIDLICATRGDAEGDRLSELSDLAFTIMTDKDAKDGKRRIVFYDVSQGTWNTVIGWLLVTAIIESDEMPAADNTKYLMLTCRVRWIAKI
jgi:hypothetical protein